MKRILAVVLAFLIGVWPTLALAQSGGNCSVFRTWATGDTVTASDLNSSFSTVGVTNMTQACIDGLSDSISNMQSTATPYSGGTESQATSGAGELQRLRYVLQTITGWPNWYRVDLPVSFTAGTHSAATAFHIAARGSLQFPVLTFGQDHRTGFFSPAAHHIAIGFDATSNSGKFGGGQTNARSWVSFHAAAITMHHTVALRFTHSQSGMGNGQYGHVTVLQITSGSTTNPNSFGFFEGNDQIVLGHTGATLRVASPVIFDSTVTGAVVSGAWSSRGQFSGVGFTTNGGHVFTLMAHAVTLFAPTNHTISTTRLNPSSINVDISDITSGNAGGATPNGADRKATFNQNTWIHFYWIWHAGSSLLRGLASEQPPTVGPNLPTGYGSWAYAGAVRRGATDASPLIATHIMGTTAFYTTPQSAVANGSAGSETTVDLSSLVPPNAVQSYLHVSASTLGSNAGRMLRLRVVSGVDAMLVRGTANSSITGGIGVSRFVPNISQRVFYLLDDSSTDRADISVNGYVLPNGG